MARDKLHTLHAVRQRLMEQARYALAACLRLEAEAAERIRAIDEAITQDRAAHLTLDNAYQFQDLFTRRDQARLAEREAANTALQAAQARSAEARALVTAARSATEVVETLMAERAVLAQAEADQRDQHRLDDMVRSRHAMRPMPAGQR